MEKTFGLIGYPLTHSWSPRIFRKMFQENELYNHSYHLFPLSDINLFQLLLENNPGLSGVNVTIPYKEAVMPFLDETDEVALAIGAVNTVTVNYKQGNRVLKGFNTDVVGFERSADFSEHNKALVLGTGGAARAVGYALKKLGIESQPVSRSSSQSGVLCYEELDPGIMDTHTLIVNATPLGMNPDEQSYPPIPYHLITPRHFLYDLVYNPAETQFLRKSALYGAMTQSGLKMLHLQAEAAFRIFTSI